MDPHLEIITGMQEVHPGVSRNDLTIDQHLAKEWNKAIGQPMCCYTFKKMIVVHRRSRDRDLKEFEDYIAKYSDIIIPNTNVRWLLSILDTFADLGQGERQVNATWISAFYKFNLVNDSMFHFLTNWEVNRNNILSKMPIREDPNVAGVRIFDQAKPMPGLEGQSTVTNLETDLIPNMARRIHNVMKDDELLLLIYYRLKDLFNDSDSLQGLWHKLRHEG